MVANRRTKSLTVVALVLLLSPAKAQIRFLTLEEAGARAGGDFAPAYEGQEVAVVGEVSSAALALGDSYVVPIQDNSGYGLLLEGSAFQVEGFTPGDWIQTRGTIQRRTGMPVLVMRDVQKFQSLPSPEPRNISVADLNSFRYIGVLVTLEGLVAKSTQDDSGDLLTIADRPNFADVFLPKARKNSGPGLGAFHAGDRVRVTGIAGQYCVQPPYNCGYRVLLPEASRVVLIEKPWSIVSALLFVAVFLIGLLLALWWMRERRMAAQRRMLRTLNHLVEEVIAAASPTEILNKLNAAAPAISEGCRVALYLYNRGSKVLESVPSPLQPVQIIIRPEAPEGAIATGIAICLRNRTLLAVPEPRRSPFFKTDGETDLPRSVMFVPMFAQREMLGVMELAYTKRQHYSGHEEQAALQHLANQVATALRLQEQKSMREKLFRSERLAAAGQLISGVATELRSPLGSILEVIAALKERRGAEYSSALAMISAEAERASEIVARLVSFGQVGHSEALPVEINGLLLSLLRFRAHERKGKGIEILPQILNQRVMVLGSQGQLEQVFLNLLVYAEQAAAEARDIAMSISTSILGKRILVEISYHTQSPEALKSDPFTESEADAGGLGLGLSRVIIQSHGGELQFVRVSATQSRFEVELPIMESGQPQIGAPSWEIQAAQLQLTVLLVEPDVATQKQIVDLLTKRGHRVIPATSAEEAADLANRMKFDVSFCSARLPGLSWIDYYERVRQRINSFVLITDGYDSEIAKAFQGGEGFVLSKPLDPAHLNRIVGVIEERITRLGADMP